MNRVQILAALEDDPAALGVIPPYRAIRPHLDIQIYDCLESTNRYLWQLLDHGAAAGTVVIARQQRAGRGQWGRPWQSPEGGLYLSLLLEVEIPTQQQGMLTLASAWGLVTALVNVGAPVWIKWPNDLVAMGRKLGGILTETRLEGQCIRYAVIGVGLNWANPVPEAGITLKTLLHETGGTHGSNVGSLETLAALTLRGILQGQQFWQDRGSTELVVAYQQRLVNLGQAVTVAGQPGKVIGVAGDGRLCIHLSEAMGQTTLCYMQPGDIHLGYGL